MIFHKAGKRSLNREKKQGDVKDAGLERVERCQHLSSGDESLASMIAEKYDSYLKSINSSCPLQEPANSPYSVNAILFDYIPVGRYVIKS